VPGPGSYDPKYSTQDPDEHNVLVKTGRDSSYPGDRIDGTGDDCTTGSEVGPGSYNAEVHNSISQKAAKSVEKTSMYKKVKDSSNPLGFTGTGPLHQLPWETRHGTASEAEATPAPGAYDPKVTEYGLGLTSDASSKETFNKLHQVGKANFNTSAAARESDIAETRAAGWSAPGQYTDVGAYDPYKGREIIDQSKQTMNALMTAGNGGFGATEKRELKLSNAITKPGLSQSNLTGVEETPGPLAYEPKVTETGREHEMRIMNGSETMKSATFASVVPRSDIVLCNAAVPGPGSYDPKYSTQDPDEHNVLVKTGRDSSYPGDRLDGGGEDSTTGPKVGPGSYSPMMTKSGEKHTMAKKIEARAELGTDASFVSSSFRTMFTALFPSKFSKNGEIVL